MPSNNVEQSSNSQSLNSVKQLLNNQSANDAIQSLNIRLESIETRYSSQVERLSSEVKQLVQQSVEQQREIDQLRGIVSQRQLPPLEAATGNNNDAPSIASDEAGIVTIPTTREGWKDKLLSLPPESQDALATIIKRYNNDLNETAYALRLQFGWCKPDGGLLGSEVTTIRAIIDEFSEVNKPEKFAGVQEDSPHNPPTATRRHETATTANRNRRESPPTSDKEVKSAEQTPLTINSDGSKSGGDRISPHRHKHHARISPAREKIAAMSDDVRLSHSKTADLLGVSKTSVYKVAIGQSGENSDTAIAIEQIGLRFDGEKWVKIG
jgi:hypothetical protein